MSIGGIIQKLADGRTDLVHDLVPSQLSATKVDPNGIPLIQWCAYYGDVSAIKHLLSHGARLDDLGSNYDLNGAAFHGHWQLCQFLLESGSDPNKTLSKTGESPLHSALCKSNRPVANMIIQLLLAYGAHPRVQTKERTETGGFMRDAFTKGETPLHRAAAFGNEGTIQLLIDAGADKQAKDMNGDTPLSWASWHERPGSILKLLTFGNHIIHDTHVQKMKSDHGSGWGSGTSILRMGTLHIDLKDEN